MLRLAKVCLSFLLLSSLAFAAGPSDHLKATLDRIFTKKEFDGKHFGPAHWIDDGAAYTTLEGGDIARYDTASGTRTLLVAASKLTPPGGKPLDIDAYALSADNRTLLVFTNTKRVWRQNTRGDYWTLDISSGRLKRLGGDAAPESSLMFAKFSPDGKSVAYVRANNIYVEDLASGKIRALTSDGSDHLINGTSDWVNEEELDIRDGFEWSPDGKRIAYWQFDTSGVDEFTLINDTDAALPKLHTFAYPQPGGKNSAVHLGIVDVAAGKSHWVETPGDPRDHYIFRFEWSADSQRLAVEYLNRLQNVNQVLLADAESGATRTIVEDRDSAWIDVISDFHWFDGSRFLLLSERDGWRHAYLASPGNADPQLLTAAPADVVLGVAVDEKGGWFYYTASPANATQRYLYRASLDAKSAPVRVTPASQAGTHTYDVSPNRRWAFHTWSSFDRPPATELVTLPDHKAIRVLESNDALMQHVKELIPSPVEFFHVTVDGGAKLDCWMIKPPGFDPSKKYPVLTQVYGEVAGTTVNDSWGGRTGLFHRAIAADGYIVLSIDNEGTPAPKGREWRKKVYREIGVLSSKQQAEAIRQIAKERPYIDASRMAIWGWSGGGSNTLNVMFRYPGVYGTGMAVAPVPDQRLYDSIYQERYSGLPADNAAGYRDGSPITFADKLAGNLLLVHGSGDDNVHFQGSERLINKLIELGKPFDFMDYPNRTHAISEGPGTSLHIFTLLARYLEDHVPAGGR